VRRGDQPNSRGDLVEPQVQLARTSIRAPNRPANVTLNIPEVYWSFPVVASASRWHRIRGGCVHRGVGDYPPLLGHGVWKRRIYPRGMKLGSKRSGRARRFKRLKTNHVVSKLGLSLGPNSLVSSAKCALGEARFSGMAQSLGTGLRPDALDSDLKPFDVDERKRTQPIRWNRSGTDKETEDVLEAHLSFAVGSRFPRRRCGAR